MNINIEADEGGIYTFDKSRHQVVEDAIRGAKVLRGAWKNPRFPKSMPDQWGRITDESPDSQSSDESRICSTPNICGGCARIVGTRVPVWGLEAARLDGCTDAEILEMFPVVTLADLRAAWGYVCDHQEEIAALVRANNEE